MPSPEPIAEQLARGAARGFVDGLADNPDAIASVMQAAARGFLSAWRVFTTPTATNAPADPDAAAVEKEITDAIASGSAPHP